MIHQPAVEGIVLGAGLHGNEPKTVEAVQGVDLPYVLPRIFHPEAVEAGVRFFGTREMGSHFPPWPENDPEDRAAVYAEKALDAFPHFLGIDLHEFSAQRGSYAFCSDHVSAQALGAVLLLGMSRVVIIPSYPMLERFPTMIGLDIAQGLTTFLLPEFWQQKLQDMYKLGVDGLRRVYEAKKDALNFFIKVNVPRVTPNGEIDPKRFAMVWDYLEEFDVGRRPDEVAFYPVHMPKPAAEALGVQGRATVIETWGDHNGSPLLPGESTRRHYFGAVLVRTSPPVSDPETGGLVFSPEREPLIKPAAVKNA